MREKLIALEQSIRADLRAIEKIFEALGAPRLEEGVATEAVIVAGYHLHNLYNAFENIFRNIATAFQNHLDDRAGWHDQLLRRMGLEMPTIRPAVIDASLYEKLDELRRFRHLFRTAYGIDLDPLRLELVVHKALALKPIYPAQIESFLAFLKTLY
jgi:hypothetical protein